MNSLQNIEYALNCEKCQALAKLTCDICHNYYVCTSHNSNHCSKPLNPLPKLLKLNPSALKSQLNSLHQDLTHQFHEFQKSFLQVQSSLNNFFNESIRNFTNTLNDLEISLGSFCENNLIFVRNKSFIQCLNTDDIRGFYLSRNEKSLKRMEEIRGFLVDGKKISAGFEELKENCAEIWEKLKNKVQVRNIEAFNDLVMELEDDLSKVSRKKVEINPGLMKNSEFFKGLPEVCPNIYWVKARVPAKSLSVLTEILPYYQKLTVLDLYFSGQADSNSLQQLKNISKLPNLTSLNLNNLDFTSLNSKLANIEFANLKVCSLVNNGTGNTGLSFFIETLRQSHNLRYLTISKNNLTQSNSNSLIGALDQWEKLSYLCISENKLDQGVVNLVDKLNTMNKVSEFHLKMNQVSTDVINKVCDQFNWSMLSRLVLGFGIELACLQKANIDKTKIFLQNNKLIINASNFISN